ncbi:hypothetical protein [Frigoriflavimonas asaccharolytica]|uniref:Uncharacterized protein n=1 Tax=Frigoriflavimonas asaccharolytica TaxID=2735899 RepID=A0A8J8GAW7_9FLAO|nr:hypothetical protein [Frigoriflavimonas asaccharolytica]NRS93177.1 hypothetical protein [Frigoriflavimonas asaccharolytica]
MLSLVLFVQFNISAQDVIIGSKPGTYNIGGSASIAAVAKLTNPANFGPNGIYSPYTISTTTITAPITEAKINAAGVKIYWSGYEQNASYTAAEITELTNWISNGGTVIAGCDSNNFSPVCSILGLTVNSGNSSAGTSTFNSSFSSCFPPITGGINNGGGAFSSFSTPLPAGLQVVTNAATEIVVSTPTNIGKPSTVLGNRIFATSDVNMFTADSNCCISPGSTVTTNNDFFLMGAISNLASLALTNSFCVCRNLPSTVAGVDTKHGITLLKRAGESISSPDNWPMVRKSAHTALESNTKGLVISRMTTNQVNQIASPQDGMMVYDTTLNCLKLYDGTTWSCFNTPTCP